MQHLDLALRAWLDPNKLEDLWYFAGLPKTPEQIARHNAAVDASSQAWASTIQQRNYVTNPVTLPAAPATGQPNFTPFGAQDDGYQNVTVMTANGYITKRCKKLRDGALHCL